MGTFNKEKALILINRHLLLILLNYREISLTPLSDLSRDPED